MIHIISWHTPLFFGERNLILNHDSRNLSQVRPDIKAKAHGGLGGEGLVDLIDVDILHLNPSLARSAEAPKNLSREGSPKNGDWDTQTKPLIYWKKIWNRSPWKMDWMLIGSVLNQGYLLRI